VCSYIILQKPDGKNEGSILDMLWKTHIIQWDKLGETLSNIYHVFHISLIKTFYRKNQEIDINLCVHCLIKNYLVKLKKKKSTMWYIITGSVQRASPLEPCKSLRLLIPMHLTHLSNIVKGNDIVNKFSWLLQDLICNKLISPLSKRWCP
jgi:hypothetical protein